MTPHFPTTSLISMLLLLTGATRAIGELAEGKLVVEPPRSTLVGSLDRLQLAVSRHAPDQQPADRTREAGYLNLTPGILAVDEQGRVRPLASGHGGIQVRHGGIAVEVSIDVELESTLGTTSFVDHVLPIMTKAGCNLGTCHASQFGKGGFKLSVFGYAPEQDALALTREWSGRRISTIRPRDSLILQKATLQIPHGGGRRFSPDSYAYDVLRTWISEGGAGPSSVVSDTSRHEVVRLLIQPAVRTYTVGQRQQLRAVAHYPDGSFRDVTQSAQFDSLDDGVAAVESEGYVNVVGPGQAAVMVRYRGQAAVSQVISPYMERVELLGFSPNNFIDEQVAKRWRLLGIHPASGCSDTDYLRRVFVDCLGTLPKPETIQSFLASSDPDKRVKLVDQLLGLTEDAPRKIYLDQWSAYWTLRFGDMLGNNRKTASDAGMWSLHNWIKQSLRENKPFDEFARQLITAQGSILEHGPANFVAYSETPTAMAAVAAPTDLAETVAQVFLGVRLQCARCHHHPFEAYSQADYYGLAAFFTRLRSKPSGAFGELGFDAVVSVAAAGSIRHPRTGVVMRPTALGAVPLQDTNVQDLRQPLADWMTSADNRLFARNIVNRIWGHYMGTGLVEPVDDLRSTNPPSNPELLDALADHFVASQFDLRQLMRTLLNSTVYQLSSTPRAENAGETRFYAHYNAKRLPAEVLLDAVDFACGTHERFEGMPPGTRAIELPDPNFESYFLDTLGRPQRLTNCECERTAEPNMAQVLHLANGDGLHRKLTDKQGRIAKLIDGVDDSSAIQTLYRVTFSRPPTCLEIESCQDLITRSPDRREGLENILWALCNSREFLFNH